MRRLFSRSGPPAAANVDKDAHGCPACPHLGLFSDDDASTLLPAHGMALDGETLAFEPVGAGALLDGDDVDMEAVGEVEFGAD